jgi:hypothetical protein
VLDYQHSLQAHICMIDPKSLERLHNNEDFLKFLEYIYGIREWCISQMHDVPTERLQQLSGRILAAEEILGVAKWQEMSEKWKRMRE